MNIYLDSCSGTHWNCNPQVQVCLFTYTFQYGSCLSILSFFAKHCDVDGFASSRPPWPKIDTPAFPQVRSDQVGVLVILSVFVKLLAAARLGGPHGQHLVVPSGHAALCGVSEFLDHPWRRGVPAGEIRQRLGRFFSVHRTIQKWDRC